MNFVTKKHIQTEKDPCLTGPNDMLTALEYRFHLVYIS